MNTHVTRRSILAGLGAAIVAPPVLSFAATPGTGIRFGYTAMTWGEQERKAVEDISAVGFPGIQFRANAVTEFKPAELKDLLARHQLTFVALSSGDVSLDEPDADQITRHLANAQFVKDSGGLYLQVLDRLKSYPRDATPDECKRLGNLLTAIGKRTADLGIPLCYHNHLNTLSQMPANLDRILASTDPKFVKLELDTAHCVAGGGDPAKVIEQYHDRLLFLHLKDVIDKPEDKTKYPFEWVELGRGKVDIPAVFAALDKVRFHGWAVVELDRVPSADKVLSPRDCALISKTYLEQKIGVRV